MKYPFLLLLSLATYNPVIIPAFAQGNTACADDALDWYTNAVGDTPCRTYERLRQICNPQFQVGIMNTNTPPDICNEQTADCCCNSIALSLSMLCLTCQQGLSHAPNGFDAGAGAYEIYLSGGHSAGTFCSPNTNKSFTNEIQSAVCNAGIKIFDSMYTRIYWSDGSWFYEWTQGFLSKDIASTGGNTFTHCDSTTSSSSPIPADASTPSPQSQSNSRIQSTSSESGSTIRSTSPNFQATSTLNAGQSSSGETTNPNFQAASTLNVGQSSPGETTNPNFVATTSGEPSASTTPSSHASSSSSSARSSLGAGAISGIVIGGVVVLILWGVFFWMYRRGNSFRSYIARPFVYETRQTVGSASDLLAARPPSYPTNPRNFHSDTP
ncbi:hypothetical protein D9758_013741 [Tetrapyrgos nigripes]|uniref:Uncharacterized protein n=1 Tax=Tetrapyrgos nigripes TaxID=182062 RepID=A0A8H5LGX0_9AGAR|nr:hypothetical protein D9758_013741 [Tetrapyrgos nigripes]